MQELGRPKSQVRVPVVLSREEVARLLGACPASSPQGLIARRLYGTGMRLTECLKLLTKDVDFDRCVVIVREGKGGKDRVVMLPEALREPLRTQLERAREIWARDRASGLPGVELPHALAAKLPRASPLSRDDRPGDRPGGGSRADRQAGDCAHAAAFVCDASARARRRHTACAGAAGSPRRQHDDDLHPPAEIERGRNAEPARRPADWRACRCGTERCVMIERCRSGRCARSPRSLDRRCGEFNARVSSLE